jgi:MFS family permease
MTPRGPVQLMFDRSFGPFFWGRLVSTCGIWMHNIVAAILAFDATHSALIVGLVSVVQFAPQVLLAPLTGQLADKGRAVVQVVIGRLVTAGGSLLLAAVVWLSGGSERIDPTMILVASAIVSVGFVVGGPAMQTVLPQLVEPSELQSVMALNGVPMTVARVLGPTSGAGIAALLGPSPALMVAAVASASFAGVVLWLRIAETHPEESPGDEGRKFSTALHYIWGDRAVVALLVATATIGIGADPAITLAPVIAETLDGGPGIVGWLASSFGIGAAVGVVGFGALAARLRVDRLPSVGLGLIAVGLVAIGTWESAALSIVLFVVAGLGMSLAFTSATTQLQCRAPEALRGRVMAVWYMAYLGSRPVAAALNGLLADIVGLRWALYLTTVLVIVAALFCLPARLGAGPGSAANA